MLREAVILAGGLATRLGSQAITIPKVLQPVGGSPFIEHLAWNLRRHGVRRLVLATGHLSDAVVSYISDGTSLGLEVRYSIEDKPLGTGGALRLALTHCEGDEALVLNGDTLLDFNYLDLATLRRDREVPFAMALREVPDGARFGSVSVDGDLLTCFAEKSGTGTLINGGVYAIAKDALASLGEGAYSLEADVLPGMVDKGLVVGRRYDGAFVDIGTPASLASAETLVRSWRDKPMLLLDRDGVLNEDRGWVHEPSDWEWMPGVVDGIKAANDAGWLVVVLTNQAGIARGMYTEDEFHTLMGWVNEQLAMRGAHLDGYRYCPHHPTQGSGEYTRRCDCRKPAPGMIESALSEWQIRPAQAVFIGDKESDMQAAAAAGIRGVRYMGGDVSTVIRAVLEGES